MVRAGISPFSAYPRCDVCNQVSGRLVQVGRWMIHLDCQDDELVTLHLPPLVYPAPRRYKNGRSEDAMVMLYAMSAKLERIARRQLSGFGTDDLVDLLKASQMIEHIQTDPPHFGPSGKQFDCSRADRIRRAGTVLATQGGRNHR